MTRPIIVVGDRTSHGGVVISGSPFTDIDGKAIARIGDKVTCPQKGHGSVTVIVTGDMTDSIDGSPVARHGDKTACGATLISSQLLTYVDDGSGLSSSPSPTTPMATSEPPKTAKAQSNEKNPYDLQFMVKGDKTGTPQVGVPYKITLDNGLVITGKTDKNGLTEKVSADYPAFATLEAPYHDNRTTDSVCGYDACCC